MTEHARQDRQDLRYKPRLLNPELAGLLRVAFDEADDVVEAAGLHLDRAQGSGCRAGGLEFRAQGSWFLGSGFRLFGFKVQVLGFLGLGFTLFGFRVQVLGF